MLSGHREVLPQPVQQRETLGGEAGPPERQGWYAPSRDCTVFRGNYCLNRHDDIALLHDVEACARTWEKYANLRLVFSTSLAELKSRGVDQAHVRIRFDAKGSMGGQSRLGKLSVSGNQDGPSMTFYGFTTTDPSEIRRTTLHEFGHALGLQHEHQSPKGGIRWNVPVVYRKYKEAGWTDEMIKSQVLTKVNTTNNLYTNFDPHSIMCYPILPEETLDGYSVQINTELSSEDIRSVQIIYPSYVSKKLGLTLGIAPGNLRPGMIVLNVQRGGSATHLYAEGDLSTEYTLEPWDIITNLGGMEVTTQDDFVKAESQVTGLYKMQILDRNTGNLIWDYGTANR